MSDDRSATPSTLKEPSTQQLDETGDPEEQICQLCGIKTQLAESRFHRGWSEVDGFLHRSESCTIAQYQTGSSLGCNVCGLIVSAINTWKQEHLSDRMPTSIWYDVTLKEKVCELVIYGMLDDNASWLATICRVEGFESMWNLLPYSRPSGDTSSLQAATTIKRWIDDCKTNHAVCKRQNRSPSTPKRILRVTDSCVQLCKDLSSLSPYACLSHCWGDAGPPLKLTSSTIDNLRNGVAIGDIPKTFHDAAKLCLSLNIWYLWIDALCIKQDDEDDWTEAAASMADIYEAATVTIAATWTNNSECGCFSKSRRDLRFVPLQESGLFVRRLAPHFPRFAGDPADGWPLLTRAWVYQERKLSTRVVHLGKEGLYWECDSAFLSEDGYEQTEETLNLRSRMEDPAIDWRFVVQHYSPLTLTFEKDRLPAISAVVKRMQRQRLGDVYVAGMWQRSLLKDLS